MFYIQNVTKIKMKSGWTRQLSNRCWWSKTAWLCHAPSHWWILIKARPGLFCHFRVHRQLTLFQGRSMLFSRYSKPLFCPVHKQIPTGVLCSLGFRAQESHFCDFVSCFALWLHWRRQSSYHPGISYSATLYIYSSWAEIVSYTCLTCYLFPAENK